MIATLFLALHLLDILSLENIIPLLYISGLLLIFCEFFIGTMGLLALNGLLSFFIAFALQSGGEIGIFGHPLDWGLVFGIAVFELALLITFGFMIMRINAQKVSTGIESMLGESASVISWSGTSGNVRVQGESWKAKSKTPLDLKPEDSVKIHAIHNLTLTVQPE